MKSTMMIAWMLVLSLTALAQNRGALTPEDRALLATEKMQTQELITEEQFDEVYAINLETAKKREAHREKMQEMMAQHREEGQKIQDERMAQLEGLLSEAQMKKLKIQQAKQKSKRGKHFRMDGHHSKWHGKKDGKGPRRPEPGR